MKAKDITLLDLAGISEVTDIFLICTVDSPRQLRALYFRIRQELKKHQIKPLSRAGIDSDKWVLCDYGDLIIHVFSAHYREFYDLELLWGDAPRIDWKAESAEKR